MFVRRCSGRRVACDQYLLQPARLPLQKQPERDVHLHMHFAGTIVLPKRLAKNPTLQFCYEIFRGIFLDKIGVPD